MDGFRQILALLIPITAIVGGLSIPILYILTHYKKRQLLLEQNHKERMLALEKGIELPPIPAALLSRDVFDSPEDHHCGWDEADKYLRSGITWLLALLPVRLSPKLLPMRFSKVVTVSLPLPPVACAVATARLRVMALLALA